MQYWALSFFSAFAPMPPEPIDLLIEARWVLPMAPDNTVLADHAVAVSSGKVVGLGPVAQMRERFEPRDRVVRHDHALMPGFVNAHTRAGMTLLRGLPVRGPRGRWLRDTVRPVEQRCMSADFVREGTQLAIAEMLRAGITCFADMNLFPEEAARAASATRMRAAIGLPVADAPNVWADSATAHFERAEQLWDEYRSDPWVCLYFAPQEAAEVSDETLVRVRRVADELDARVAMEAPPLRRLHSLGLLRPGFAAIPHSAWKADEVELVSTTGMGVIRCLQGDLRLGAGVWGGGASGAGAFGASGAGAFGASGAGGVGASGAGAFGASGAGAFGAPGVSAFGASGGGVVGADAGALAVGDSSGGRTGEAPPLLTTVVGLGSGHPVSVGALDLLAEARTAALLSGGSLSAIDALRLATLGGAMVLGFAADTGSIEPGKYADLICVDLKRLASQPTSSVPDSILFGATREQVSDVWTSGRLAVSEGHLLGFDEDELMASALRWQKLRGDK
ncbi:MAG: amidohydrolase family protein [Proteobacteria bacterium]|nr:amidohydrolase family protein [Pseudomonadota bacterium]